MQLNGFVTPKTLSVYKSLFFKTGPFNESGTTAFVKRKNQRGLPFPIYVDLLPDQDENSMIFHINQIPIFGIWDDRYMIQWTSGEPEMTAWLFLLDLELTGESIYDEWQLQIYMNLFINKSS
jgi:hypothetical protein